MRMEILQAKEDLMIYIETFLKKFNHISFRETPKVLRQAWDKFFEIKHAQSKEVQELLFKLLQDMQSINEELAEYINTPSCNLPTSSYDDDDDEYSFATQEYIMTCSTAITPVLLTKEPVDSLIIEDEHLDTIPATESDEFIKSSAENLVPTPSESEDASDGKCNLPICTFSNPLFDINDDFTSSNDESFSGEDVLMENFKFFSNPLFDLDEEIISMKVDQIDDEVLDNISIDSSPKIDSFLDEFAGELTLLKSIPPGIDDDNIDPEGETHLVERLLYDNSSPRPLEELNVENSIESFSPSPIPFKDSDSLVEEIDVFLASDDSIPPGIESDDYDSEVDDNSASIPEFKSFHVDHPDSGDSTIDVVEDIPVDVPNILPTYPTLHMDFDFIPSNDLGSDHDVSSPSGDRNKIYDPGICIEVVLASILLSQKRKLVPVFKTSLRGR
ncbi:hypothetical protein Tco_0871620, partial [Tanacetum coccineum]